MYQRVPVSPSVHFLLSLSLSNALTKRKIRWFVTLISDQVCNNSLIKHAYVLSVCWGSWTALLPDILHRLDLSFLSWHIHSILVCDWQQGVHSYQITLRQAESVRVYPNQILKPSTMATSWHVSCKTTSESHAYLLLNHHIRGTSYDWKQTTGWNLQKPKVCCQTPPPIFAIWSVERQHVCAVDSRLPPLCSVALFLTLPAVGLAALCCLIDFLPRRIDTLRACCSSWQTARVDLAGSFDSAVIPGVKPKQCETGGGGGGGLFFSFEGQEVI